MPSFATLLSPPAGTIGLLDAAGLELTASDGRYTRQRVAASAWSADGDTLTGPDVMFTGFVAGERAVSFVLEMGDARLVFALDHPRAFLAIEDVLIITPIVELRADAKL